MICRLTADFLLRFSVCCKFTFTCWLERRNLRSMEGIFDERFWSSVRKWGKVEMVSCRKSRHLEDHTSVVLILTLNGDMSRVDQPESNSSTSSSQGKVDSKESSEPLVGREYLHSVRECFDEISKVQVGLGEAYGFLYRVH